MLFSFLVLVLLLKIEFVAKISKHIRLSFGSSPSCKLVGTKIVFLHTSIWVIEVVWENEGMLSFYCRFLGARIRCRAYGYLLERFTTSVCSFNYC